MGGAISDQGRKGNQWGKKEEMNMRLYIIKQLNEKTWLMAPLHRMSPASHRNTLSGIHLSGGWGRNLSMGLLIFPLPHWPKLLGQSVNCALCVVSAGPSENYWGIRQHAWGVELHPNRKYWQESGALCVPQGGRVSAPPWLPARGEAANLSCTWRSAWQTPPSGWARMLWPQCWGAAEGYLRPPCQGPKKQVRQSALKDVHILWLIEWKLVCAHSNVCTQSLTCKAPPPMVSCCSPWFFPFRRVLPRSLLPHLWITFSSSGRPAPPHFPTICFSFLFS